MRISGGTPASSRTRVKPRHVAVESPSYVIHEPRATPLLGTVTHAIHQRLSRASSLHFALHQVHGRSWEVVEPSRVIEVQVRKQDVTHVAGVKAERLDLAYRGVRLLELGPQQRQEHRVQSRPRRGDVAEPVAGVDEDQLRRGLDQQAVRR